VAGTATLDLEALPRGAPTRGAHWPDVAAVAGPAALAAMLAASGLTGRSLGFDEAASVTIAAQHGHALGQALGHDGGNMAGYYVLLHVIIAVFGRGLVAIRLPSAIAAAATVAPVGVLALRLFGRRAALFAGLLGAVSLPLIFWGQSARGYAPVLAFVTASWLSFVSLLERRRWSGPAYVIATTLAIYASFVAALAIAAQLVVLLWDHRRPKAVLTAVAAVALCCVPLAVLALDRGSGQLFWVPRPDVTSTKQVLETLASAGLPPSFRPSATTAVLTVLTGATILGVGLSRERRPATRLALSWLIVPFVLALIESLLGQSIFLPRNLLVTLPAVALLLAVALTDRRVPRHAAWALLALLIALRAVPLVASYGVSPEDWKASTAYVLARTQPGDCVAFYPSDARMPFAYYLAAGRRLPRPVLPAAKWGSLRPYVEDYATLPGDELGRLPARCRRLWLVSSHEGQRGGPAGSRSDYARFVALRSALRQAYARHRATAFGYAAVIQLELLSRP
jgi:mannosyltransferase